MRPPALMVRAQSASDCFLGYPGSLAPKIAHTLATSYCGADTALTAPARAAYPARSHRARLSQGSGMFLEMSFTCHARTRHPPLVCRHSARWSTPPRIAYPPPALVRGLGTRPPALHCVTACVLPPGTAHTNASAARCRCAGPAPAGQPPPHFVSLRAPCRARFFVPVFRCSTCARRRRCCANPVYSDPPPASHDAPAYALPRAARTRPPLLQ
ncbi:hypothetical protein B0H14DRAFT_3461782 [Mycena olivaceomarginata]|nr:hypothetical protein B0H14DRAFT_3461782 [Mycena olivaceomarginata]